VCVCACVCVCVCVCTTCLWFGCLVLFCTLNDVNVRLLYHVSVSTHSSPKLGILSLGGQ